MPTPLAPQPFDRWLAAQLAERHWSARELARQAGIAHTSVANVLAGQQSPSWDFCTAIAPALELSPIALFLIAGKVTWEDVRLLLPDLPATAGTEERLVAAVRQLPADKQQALLAFLQPPRP